MRHTQPLNEPAYRKLDDKVRTRSKGPAFRPLMVILFITDIVVYFMVNWSVKLLRKQKLRFYQG